MKTVFGASPKEVQKKVKELMKTGLYTYHGSGMQTDRIDTDSPIFIYFQTLKEFKKK